MRTNKQKQIILLGVGILLVLAGGLTVLGQWPLLEQSVFQVRCEKIRVGMSQQEVQKLLGSPGPWVWVGEREIGLEYLVWVKRNYHMAVVFNEQGYVTDFQAKEYRDTGRNWPPFFVRLRDWLPF